MGDGPGKAVHFEDLETAARRCGLQLAAHILESVLNGDLGDCAGSFLACRCGAQARYVGRRAKTVLTMVGELRLERAYYHCHRCGRGFCPRDAQLNSGRGGLSTGVLRIVGTTAALVSFEETAELLDLLAGLPISGKQAERVAEALGKEIGEDECGIVAEAVPRSTTMYLGMDGTAIPMRQAQLAGRKGKQPDGSAKTREVKLVTIWSADRRNKEGRAERDPGSVSYNAAIESAATADTDETLSDFAWRVQREATRRGFDAARRRVIIGDGAKWIWKMAEELFPGAVQIVDLYHAKGTLSDVAKAIFGAENEEGKLWAKCRRDELEEGKQQEILQALNPYLKTHKEAQTCHDYIQANSERLQYPKFRSRGLCTSSGVVEAGCKLAIGTRLKRAGMHWTLHGANEIIALRCCKLSGRYDAFWERKNAA